MKRKAWLLSAMTIGFASFANANTGELEACFYEHENYTGTKWCANGVGDFTVPSWFNDKTTSIQLKGHVKVTAFRDGGHSGPKFTTFQDVFSLHSMNDEITSIRVKAITHLDFACLYGKRGFDRTPECASSDQSVSDLDWRRNHASSVFVSGNAQARLYSYPNFGSSYKVLNKSEANLSDIGFNDDTDSFKIAYAPKKAEIFDIINAQNEISHISPFYASTWVGTHNSFNSGDYYYPSAGKNQNASLVEQLEAGVRHIELDMVNKTLKHKVDVSGTSFVRVLTDVKDWLKSNPDEFVIVKFEHGTRDQDAEQSAANDINRVLGDWVYKDAANGCTFLPKTVSVRDMLKQGKRILFYNFENDCHSKSGDYQAIMWGRNKIETSEFHDYNQSCPDGLPGHDEGDLSVIVEDVRGKITNKYVPNNRIRSALECGLNAVTKDKFDPTNKDGWLSEHNYTWKSGFQRPTENLRAVAFEIRFDDYAFKARNKSQAQFALCRSNDDNSLFDVRTGGNWEQAFTLCANQNAKLSMPTNAYEAAKFFDSHKVGPNAVVGYWMDYQAVGSKWVANVKSAWFNLKNNGKCIHNVGGSFIEKTCSTTDWHQQWYYDDNARQMVNRFYPEDCLRSVNGNISLQTCTLDRSTAAKGEDPIVTFKNKGYWRSYK